MRDWQAGALNTKYFLEKINELNTEILKHEETAAPPGWLCHWNSEFKMYYYNNVTTGNSQWEYPDASQHATVVSLPTSHASSYPSSQVLVMQPHMIPMMNATPDYTGGMMVSNAMNEASTMSASAASLVSPAHGFSREPIPSETKKRSAADSELSSDPYRDPYRLSKKKKEVSTFPDQVEESQLGSEPESGTSSPVPKTVIAAAPVIRNVSREASPALQGPSDEYDVPFFPVTQKAENPTHAILNSKNKLKKKKKLDASGLPSKKMKQVSSLVQKWQTVKQKVEEEENVEEEFEEDVNYEVQSAKRITEWKKEIEASGKKEYNPNFTEIRGDWRNRLKRKTTT